MRENPHIRNIKILQPEIDLTEIDRPKGSKRKPGPKRPAHPAEGLLDDADLSPDEPSSRHSSQTAPVNEKTIKPDQSEIVEQVQTPTSKDDSKIDSQIQESSEKFSTHTIGDAPEEISGDFPDPIDI